MTLKNQAIQTALSGNWEEAIVLNKSLVDEDPKDIDALNRLALAYSIIGKAKEAKSTYLKVVDLDPLNAIALRNLKKLKEKNLNAEGFINGYLCYPGHHLSLNTEPVKVITLMDATFRQILDNKIPKNALRTPLDPLLKGHEKNKKRKASLQG